MNAGYVYMVTVDGTSQGDYEGCASSFLFSTSDDAVDYINNDLSDCVVNTVFAGDSYTDVELKCAVEKYCKWYEGSAQFRYGDCVMDYKIERTAVPEIIEKGI